MIERDEACPACQSVGNDQTGNHLMVFENDGGKFCNRCQYTVNEKGDVINKGLHDYDEDAVPSDTTVIPFDPSAGFPVEFPQVHGTDPGSFDSKEFRCIPADIRGYYGVTTEVDKNSKPLAQFYPVFVNGDLHTYKKRTLPKDFIALKPWKGLSVDLFGQNIFGAEKTCIITEGEEDAMAAHWMLKKYRVAAVSLPTGANTSAISDNMKFLKKFKEIVLCCDQDKKGEAVTRDIAKLLPQAKVMTMSEKDACDMLMEGKEDQFVNDFFQAERWKPNSIVNAGDARSQALVDPEMGKDYPFEGLTKFTYGFRTKRVIGIGAGPGAGKTCFVKAIQMHLIHKHNIKLGVFPLEETPGEALREMAGYVMNKPLDKPGTIYSKGDLETILDGFKDKVMIYDSENYEGWGDIEEAIRYMAHSGVKAIFIDPLSALHSHLSASESNEFLTDAMWQMSKMVKSLDLTIFHTNHLNNAQTSKDHGAGGKVYASQFTGSRAQWKYSSDIWGLERDQYSEDNDVRNTTNVVNLKYRKPSLPGNFSLKYDDKTGTLSEGGSSVFAAI